MNHIMTVVKLLLDRLIFSVILATNIAIARRWWCGITLMMT